MKMDRYLGITLLEEEVCLRLNTHNISYYRTSSMEHKVVFVYCDSIMTIANWFHCLMLYCVAPVSSACCELPDEYIIEKPMPVARRTKAWVCVRSLAGIGVGIPPRAWKSVCCECCGSEVEVWASDDSSGGSYRVCCVWVLSRSFVKREAMTGIRAEAPQKENGYIKWTHWT
jgi:hypothetical protein